MIDRSDLLGAGSSSAICPQLESEATAWKASVMLVTRQNRAKGRRRSLLFITLQLTIGDCSIAGWFFRHTASRKNADADGATVIDVLDRMVARRRVSRFIGVTSFHEISRRILKTCHGVIVYLLALISLWDVCGNYFVCSENTN